MGVIADDVRNGRMIYIDNCARCHRPEAVTRYTETQWQKILPWMSDQALLSPEDAAAVKAYVLVTLRTTARVAEENAQTPPTTVPADP
jgi:mono/diheme cytochrome c family protein